jgi:enterochelin esterase-like enzyme
MRFRRESPEDARRPGCSSWLLRSLAVVGLTVLIALVVLVRPLREAPGPSPTPDIEDPVPAGTSAVSATSEASALVLATDSLPDTPTPTPTATPSPMATNTPSPAPSLTPTSAPTAVPSPTVMPSDTPAPVATVAVQPTTPAPLAGRLEQGAYFSQVTSQEEPYRVYLPPGYDQGDRRYPVLYLLHGWPYDEAHWDMLGVDEVADQHIVAGLLHPFIIVLPGADASGLYVTTSGGSGSFEEQLVNELMPHVDATLRTLQIREARAIGGISRGGVWALEIAFQHPDAFGIVGAHSPALSANRAPSVYDPFTLMREPGVGSLRIYLSAGDADWARPATVELHQALNQQGIGHQLAIHPGVHRDQLWSEHLGEYLTFYAAGW